jgi:hypothetical protein
MLGLVMIIYLVYEHNMIVIVHINMMWPTINKLSRRRSYVILFSPYFIIISCFKLPRRQARD